MKEILKILEQDAKVSPEKIATMVGLSVEEVKEKISELEKKKAIIKYRTVVDWEKAGEEVVYAFIEVKVTPERDHGFDAVASRIYRFPEVHSLYLMAGDYDLSVVIEGKSMKEIAYFVAEKLAPLEQVQSTATHFVLKRYKVDGVILEGKEEDRRLPITP
ncbi:MAG: Lrp/AsnC family transcriptional regulator [bacterium]|nr:Lrp/AsnC family transcriptional regulator [bacterium]